MWFANIINFILDLLFPNNCIGCGKMNELICPKCQAKCERDVRHDNKISSLYIYANPIIRRGIWKLKYKGNREIAKIFAKMISDFLLEEISDFERLGSFKNPVLVPIPITKSSLRERGFNQAELIAQELSKLTSLKINTNSLIKVKRTKRQATLSRKERLDNVRDCHLVIDKDLSGRAVILIDDVFTTGATIADARRALRTAGVRKVKAVTLAH